MNNTGSDYENYSFAIGIGFYPVRKPDMKECPGCKGTKEGELAFADGIGPYPTVCRGCNGEGEVPGK